MVITAMAVMLRWQNAVRWSSNSLQIDSLTRPNIATVTKARGHGVVPVLCAAVSSATKALQCVTRTKCYWIHHIEERRVCGHVARTGNAGNTRIRNVTRKLEWKRSLGRLRNRWKDNIKRILKIVTWRCGNAPSGIVKSGGFPWRAERLRACQEGPRCMKFLTGYSSVAAQCMYVHTALHQEEQSQSVHE
jgi:hypothetical protein